MIIDNYSVPFANYLQESFSLSADVASVVSSTIILAVIIAFGILVDLVIQLVIMPIVARIVRKTETKLDDMLLDGKVIAHFSKLLPVYLVKLYLPAAFVQGAVVMDWLSKICVLYLIVVFGQMLFAFYTVAEDVLDEDGDDNGRPYNIIFQVLRIITFLVCAILIFSYFADKSPASILTGLGASAVVMSLILKDTIVGLVSSIQLSGNDMLRIGDWISVPAQNINGYVVEVKLHTVKIQNFDMSVVTIPPSNLLNNTFINWRNMQQGGARRICRSVNIDISSVDFCSQQMLQDLRSFDLLVPVLDAIEKNDGKMPDGTKPTNIGLLRAYLVAFIENFPLSFIDPEKKYFYMVRQLEPTPHGLPLELYFFVKEVRWTHFEKVQSDVFDQVFAAIPQFGLRVFQDIHN